MATSIAATDQGSPGNAPSVGKPRELEDSLNLYIYHPLSRRLARRLVPTPVTPNMVSVAGALLVAAAAFSYTGLSWPVSVLIGFALHALWHVVDGADGDLARLTGRASPIGELVDGACDYLSHLFLYGLLAAFLDDLIGWIAWPLAIAAGLSRALQANHAESQRRIYLWRVYGVPWLKQAEGESPAIERRSLFARIFAPVGRFYVALASALSPSAEVDRLYDMPVPPQERERLRRLARFLSRRSLPIQRLLGANQRTVLLAISMAIGSPLPFFVLECTLFNLLLIASVRRQNRCNRSLATHLLRAPRRRPAALG